MSHSCTTDVVPFVIHSISGYSCGDFEDTELARMLEPDTWTETHGSDENMSSESGYDCEPGEIRGWEEIPYDEKTYKCKGKRKRLFVSSWKKGEHEISFINEEQFSNVGEADFSVFAETKEALEAFVADFPEILESREDFLKKEPLIYEKDSVSQWG